MADYSYPPNEILSQVYATDENIAVRAAGDFGVLCPAWQQLAFGTDGVFSSDDLFALTSASVDFVAAGVHPQHVMCLEQPTTVYKGQATIAAVDTVDTNSVTLRRLGKGSAGGSPFSPTGGLTSVQFRIVTLDPQIEEETFILNRRFAIDPNTPGRQPSDMNDLRDLRYACVMGVLSKRYQAETREERGDFAAKAKRCREELEEVYARLTITWSSSTLGQNTTQWFSTRIVR